MMPIVLIALCLVSKYSCLSSIAAPLLNNRHAPLVAIVDTGKVVEQITKSLDGPVRELIKDYVEKTLDSVTKEIYLRLNLREKQLNETKSHDQSNALPLAIDCTDLLNKGSTSGVYRIYPDSKNGISAYCDMNTDGGGWTVFQKRINWQISFNRSWTEYENGFGNVYTEYWLGNKYIHQLTANAKYELRVELLSLKGEYRYAVYKTFILGDAASKYRLTADTHYGNLSEALQYNYGGLFSTVDQDNDLIEDSNEAMDIGAWWYKFGSGTGIWINHDTAGSYWGGFWGKKSVMMIRKIK